MGVLAAYDTVGIQNYIFSSNKLAENVGASKLVAAIFAEHLTDVMENCFGEPLPDWRAGESLHEDKPAEIVYLAGGNAFVAFRREEDFQLVTRAFLIRVAQVAPGVGVAVAAVETDFGNTYQRDMDFLGKRLTQAKGGFTLPVFFGNQPITKQSLRTGQAVSAFMEDEYVSIDQLKKRDADQERKRKTANLVENFADLAFEKEADSVIAIIHADGNNMGKRIAAYMKAFTSYQEAVPCIRRLARDIHVCYQAARDTTTEAFAAAYPTYCEKHGKTDPQLPLLSLVAEGDDTTLLISGRFALDYAARLLREIENQPNPFGDDTPFTACAGVVLFHNHYPFSEAYKLAESLCASAKKASRDAHHATYLDFHLHQSGGVAGLSALRKQQYLVDGKTILQRPWRVVKITEPAGTTFRWFEETADKLKDEERYPRNKLKALRNAIGAGDIAAKAAENLLRETKLPKFPEKPPANRSPFAPHFDMLELYDDYVNLLNQGGAKDAE